MFNLGPCVLVFNYFNFHIMVFYQVMCFSKTTCGLELGAIIRFFNRMHFVYVVIFVF